MKKLLLLMLPCFSSLYSKCFAQDAMGNIYSSAIKTELLEMKTAIDADRQNLYIVTAECGYQSKEAIMGRQLSRILDSLNLLKIKSIIHVYGYLGPKSIGYEAGHVMFSVIYNSNIDTAKKFVPIMWQAVLKGEAAGPDYAALADKVALHESHAQIYGTVIWYSEGKYYLPRILDTLKVDSIRNIIGLPPLDEYLKPYGLNKRSAAKQFFSSK